MACQESCMVGLRMELPYVLLRIEIADPHVQEGYRNLAVNLGSEVGNIQWPVPLLRSSYIKTLFPGLTAGLLSAAAPALGPEGFSVAPLTLMPQGPLVNRSDREIGIQDANIMSSKGAHRIQLRRHWNFTSQSNEN